MVEIPPIQEKDLWCPQCKMITLHEWDGWFRHYSAWICRICGL